MAYPIMTTSPGSGKPEIDEILRYSSVQYAQKARMEYDELLTTEVKLAKEDQDMVIII